MENQDHYPKTCLGAYPTPACGPCPETDRCKAFYWLEQWDFRKHNDPPERHDYLVATYWVAVDEALAKFQEVTYTHRYDPSRCTPTPDCPACPDMDFCANPRGVKRYPVDKEKLERQRESFIIARLRKAKEAKVRELRALEVRAREEAAAIDASGPKGSGRFPPGWMVDIANGHRGARELMHLLTLIKEMAKVKSGDDLVDELVASGRSLRKDLVHPFTDKSGKKRSRPLALFQMNYELAAKRYGWKKSKVRRLLKLACDAGVIYPLAKSPAENGLMVYCAGYWMIMDGKQWVIWLCKDTPHWRDVFRGFRCTAFPGGKT